MRHNRSFTNKAIPLRNTDPVKTNRINEDTQYTTRRKIKALGLQMSYDKSVRGAALPSLMSGVTRDDTFSFTGDSSNKEYAN